MYLRKFAPSFTHTRWHNNLWTRSTCGINDTCVCQVALSCGDIDMPSLVSCLFGSLTAPRHGWSLFWNDISSPIFDDPWAS